MASPYIDNYKYILDTNNESLSWNYEFVTGLRHVGLIDDDDVMVLNKHINDMEECHE